MRLAGEASEPISAGPGKRPKVRPQKGPLLVIAMGWLLVLSSCSVRAFANYEGGSPPSDREVAIIYNWSGRGRAEVNGREHQKDGDQPVGRAE